MRMVQESLVVITVSGIIGALVGLPFVISGGYPLMPGIIMSAVTGIIIGISASCAFMVAYRQVYHNTALSFLLVFSIIAAGTFLGPYMMGYRDYLSILLMIICAEIAGMAATFIIYRKSKVLNRSLLETQEKYRR